MASPALSLLLLGLLVPLVRPDDINCKSDPKLPGCKATCPGSTPDQNITIDISNLFSYPVNGIVGDDDANPNVRANYSYDCAGGLSCTDATRDNVHNTAVCQNGKVYKGLAAVEIVAWTLLQTKPLSFSVEYGGAEGTGGISNPSLFIFSEKPGSGSPQVVFNEPNPKLTFQVTGDCLTLACEGGEDIAGPIGLVLISLAILAVIAYFIIGSLVMYFARGARGIEVIPNVMFWKDFPFLLKDGVLFIVSPCYKGGDYEKI